MLFVLGLIAVILLLSCVRVIPQSNVYIVEFLGKYKATWEAGLHLKLPIVERVAKRISLKEQVADFPPQPVITKDNVTIQIDTVVFYSIFDAKAFCYGVNNPLNALANLTATTVRNIIGSLELDDTLISRDVINAKMLEILDDATDKWGIKINRVELKNIIPPKDIQEAMEKQMRAEREKRQTLLEAEAHKESSVLRAEGDKRAMVLKAEAESEAAIAIAKGKAESIRMVYEAEAEGLRLLSNCGVNNSVLQLKQLEALKALGDGQATKLIVPTELASTVSNLAVVADVFKPAPTFVKEEDVEYVDDDCCDKPDVSEITRMFVDAE